MIEIMFINLLIIILNELLLLIKIYMKLISKIYPKDHDIYSLTIEYSVYDDSIQYLQDVCYARLQIYVFISLLSHRSPLPYCHFWVFLLLFTHRKQNLLLLAWMNLVLWEVDRPKCFYFCLYMSTVKLDLVRLIW